MISQYILFPRIQHASFNIATHQPLVQDERDACSRPGPCQTHKMLAPDVTGEEGRSDLDTM